ncbi:hypothetical protein O6P43_026201 [Quillaja saponaria]|uniref:Secreted protein n=1 Tax=Quillaja saponaria TaxID=32244 RepID=A0AAD7LAQ7_QUISA|nr:hypothetical protein O6P43_026201 [Quillaja saponaria]
MEKKPVALFFMLLLVLAKKQRRESVTHQAVNTTVHVYTTKGVQVYARMLKVFWVGSAMENSNASVQGTVK